VPDLYAYRLPLAGDGVALFAQAMHIVRAAVSASAGVVVTDERGSTVGVGASAVRWRLAEAPDSDDRVWTMLWESPISGDSDTTWALTVKVGLDGGQAFLVLRWGVLTRDLRMRRIELGLEPPPLLLTLLDGLPVEEDGQPLAPEPSYAVDLDSAEHLAELLLDPRRVLPVVAMSATRRREGAADVEPLIEPGPVTRTLAGVAHVVVVETTAATRTLTRILGPRLTVFGGAVRLYWPGLTPWSEPLDHTLWLPEAIRNQTARALRRELLDRVMPMALIRFSTADLEARIGMAIERQRREELRQLAARAQEASLAVDWQQELETAWSENERLREGQARLSAQLSAAHENLRALAAGWSTTAPASVLEESERGDDEPSSIAEAVERAIAQCPCLVFLDEALDSARRATYRQPARVLKALRAMNAAASAWQRDDLEGGFRRAFAEQGLDYGPSLSTSAVGRFPHEYERTYRDQRIVLGPHIRLGRGSPEACCRIYFYMDGEARLFVVGHVGNHLSDRTSG
jgi:hypothetical protein